MEENMDFDTTKMKIFKEVKLGSDKIKNSVKYTIYSYNDGDPQLMIQNYAWDESLKKDVGSKAVKINRKQARELADVLVRYSDIMDERYPIKE
jgi:hypothetical protein